VAEAFAHHVDRAAVEIDDALHERQPEAEATGGACQRPFGLHERFEDPSDHQDQRPQSRR